MANELIQFDGSIEAVAMFLNSCKLIGKDISLILDRSITVSLNRLSYKNIPHLNSFMEFFQTHVREKFR